ncbi:YciI family protein [Actinoplanes sp. NPDC020271]|uniref:YciI family protein n=1 Tax=Actinoplanes sp. NPDC020271 TaxID=3363896 RepID=UPI0037952A5B
MIRRVEFLCYHRDRAGSGDLRLALREQHWAYMDRFADRMIARGPTFDGETLTGSLHILDLPDPAAARAFAFEEPGYQAGAYRDVLIRRWENRLGRTMWDFPAGRAGGPYFLVLGLGEGPAADLAPGAGEWLIAQGPLLSDDGSQWLGTAALVHADSPARARRVLTADRYAAVEVHAWAFGGRPA